MGKKRHRYKQSKGSSIECKGKPDIDKWEGKQETCQMADDSTEQRRANRLGAVIGILAVMTTIWLVAFNLLKRFMLIGGVQDITNLYIKVLLIIIVSVGCLVFLRLICFVFADLERYDVLKEGYKQCDENSDKSYNLLVKEFKLYCIFLYVILLFEIPVSLVAGGIVEINCAGIIILILIVIVLLTVVKLIKCKKINAKLLLWNLLKLILIGSTVTLVGIVAVIPTKSVVDIEFKKNGDVIIANTSTLPFAELKWTLYDEMGQEIHRENISKERMLFAKEEKYVSSIYKNDGTESLSFDGERIHWRYDFNLNVLMLEKNHYIIKIDVMQQGRHVELWNSFELNGDYKYAMNVMHKDY